MRPIKLSMTAFGPFIATETVDFEVFGERPLFLINGDTGAGKTTILDAICFALYGQTTGKEREPTQMRCDYADDNTATTVEFTFELSGVQYRILRMPEQTRAKKSGEGTTTQKARAELYLIGKDGETVLVPEKVTEATQKIEELTGLLVDQFRQVMVLPQGQFRRLLMADSKDREQIFSQLFETGIYKKIEDKLKQRASKVESQVKTLKNEQHGVLQTVEFEGIEALQASIDDVSPELAVAAKLKADKDSAYLVSMKLLDEAAGLDKDFANLQSLSGELTALEQKKADTEAKEKRLSLADQALKIKPVFTEQLRLKSELNVLAQEKEMGEKVLQQADDSLKQATLDLEQAKALEKDKDQFKQRIDVLKGYRDRASKLQQTQADLKQADSAHQKCVAVHTQSTQQLEQFKAQQKQSELDKKKLEQQLTKEAEVAAQAQKLAQAVQTRQRYDALLVEKTTQQAAFTKVIETGKAAAANKSLKDKESKQLDLAWHSGQAAILAGQLQQDQPCLVCGSVEHPAPAQATVDIPTDEQREAAQRAVETAQVRLDKAREEYTRLNSHLKALEPQLVELLKQLDEFADLSLAQLKQQHAELAAQLASMQKSREQLSKIDHQLDELKRSLTAAEAKLQQTQQQSNDSKLQLQKYQTEVELAQKELPEAYRESGKLEADIATVEASLTRLIKQVETIQQAHTDAGKKYSTAEASLQNLAARYEALNKTTEAATKEWQTVLKKSVFETDEEFAQADLAVDEQERLKQSVSHYQETLQTLKGAFEERKKSLVGKKPPDLTVLQSTLDSALSAKNQAEQDWQQVDKHLNRLQEAKKSYDKLAAKQQTHEQEYKVIGTLSNVANGTTGNKISLQRFVLGVLLDDVLREASSRLKLMSSGRYHLLRKEDRAKGNKASGLEMEVEDTYTGKLRAVSTLSGGESFLASLSLALGLSDVVQAYAGGIRLDTLFIDEGFGSLDADTLDLAIKTLIDLRNTGRMVGIISHVPELKEQITMRLDVIGGRQGSTIKLIY